MSVSTELADFIGTQISTLEVGANLFDWILPDDPDEAISIRDTGGVAATPEANITDQSFQITARAAKGKPTVAEANLKEVHDLLVAYVKDPDALKSITTPSFLFRGFRSVSTPQTIGLDDKQRPVYTINISSFITDSV